MPGKYKIPTYPPLFSWDERLIPGKICEKLQPVSKIHENNWFHVFNRGGYFTIEPTQSHCVILPIINDMAILMVRVYRPVIDDITLELPAGAFDPDTERPEEGAARELLEETGVMITDLNRFIPLLPISISPNRNPYLAYAFQIEISEDEYNERKNHDHEVERIEKVGFSKAKQYIRDGTVYISVPLAIMGRFLLSR